MSFLQYTPSPPSERNGGGWKVRNNDLAVEEILSERRAAVRSGKLKGRRLFPVSDGASGNMCPGGREEIACSGLSSIGGESEERSLWSYDYSDDENEKVETKKAFSPVCLHCATASTYSSLSSSPPSSISYDKVVVEEKEMVDVETVEEKKRRAETGPCESRTQEKVFMAWLGILLTLFAVGFITARTLRGNMSSKFRKLLPGDANNKRLVMQVVGEKFASVSDKITPEQFGLV
ncbi:hypothetical protein K2173_027489 [Erythroxylum novogranatense]|uniref:Uncharacterized protein n=1 Tax=Erythroxylum novogranatense TaxID=1862640 RepID=A0AAV8TZ47_9ROSI|nr:hypothetical protein K2173_027489 [Erythroxylum novogranatense]